MPGTQSRPKRPRTFRVWLSYLLFAVSAGLFIAVLVLYLRDRNEEKAPPVPTATSGHYEMRDVRAALQDEGLDAEFGRSADRAIGLTEAAQAITIGDETIYIFIYPDTAQRQRDQDRLQPDDLTIVNTRGTPVADNTPIIHGGSNVLIAVFTDDASLNDKIAAAIDGFS